MKIGVIVLCLCLFTGCANLYETDQQQALIGYIIRQNTLNEVKLRQQETKDAVRQFQVQAIRGGFAYWDVDINGNVEFKWVGQKRK